MSKTGYVGVDGKARKVKAAYVGVPTEIPMGDFKSYPLTVENIDKFFTVTKTSGTDNYTPDDLDPDDYCSLSCGSFDIEYGWTGDYNSASNGGEYSNNEGKIRSCSGSITFLQACSVSISLSHTDEYCWVQEDNADEPTPEQMTSWSGYVSKGDSISFGCDEIYDGETASFSITITDNDITIPHPGTPGDFTVTTADNGGIKLVPGIFGEPLTWCEIELSAKKAITGVLISAEYHTEDNCDMIELFAGSRHFIGSGDKSFGNLWANPVVSLAAGESIRIKYSKDQSVDATDEHKTFFKITCDPVTEGEITGYETRDVARKVVKGYIGVGGVAKCFYEG